MVYKFIGYMAQKAQQKMKRQRRPQSQEKKPLDWSKFTDFRGRRSRDHLAKLCSNFDRSQLVQIFSSPDKTGLYPIHWAAVHNRSDLIEFMLENGSPLHIKCNNKLLADGTALHLASMNGSIEAASMLLKKCDYSGSSNRDETRQLILQPVSSNQPSNEQPDMFRARNSISWLSELDAEGQTPLMRSAPPRSKRMDTVRDLLRKNLWSLSGRPAEMALFLINKGADWRQTDSINGMNLMHLAIVNDYDDIVNLLLVIDRQLLKISVRLINHNNAAGTTTKTTTTTRQAIQPVVVGEDDNLKPVNLNDDDDEVEDSSTQSNLLKPLIGKQTKATSILEAGLTPLQLAIVYERLSVISLLWHADTPSAQAKDNVKSRDLNSDVPVRTTTNAIISSSRDLKMILLRVCWSNRNELFALLRASLLKLALALDLILLTLVWIPVYLIKKSDDDETRHSFNAKSGIFIASYCLTSALAFKVMLKNPGYLRRSSIQYLSELRLLVGHQALLRVAADSTTPTSGLNQPSQQLKGSNNIDVNNNDNNIDNSTQQQVIKEPMIDKRVSALINVQQQPTVADIEVEERVRLLCHKCRCIRRPRSRHCNYCNHCVQDFDHHCIYLSCCIGRKNRLDFLLLMIVLAITAIYGTVLHSTSLTGQQWHEFWHFVGLIWIFKYALIGGLTAFLILRRACFGVTMFEAIRSGRIRQIFGPQGPPDSISRSHKVYSIAKGSFWRYQGGGDNLTTREFLYNLREFTNFTSIDEYLLSVVCADSALARSIPRNDSKIDIYKFI